MSPITAPLPRITRPSGMPTIAPANLAPATTPSADPLRGSFAEFARPSGPDLMARTAPIVPLAFAGVGAIGLGTAFVMHLGMTSRANELGDHCAPRCSQSDRDDLSDRLILRNVAFGIGIGALVVAAVTYVVTMRR